MTLLRWVALALLLTLGVGCRTATIYNVQHAPLNVRPSTTSNEVADAIREAARKRGWTVQDVGPGEMRAMITSRGHTAVVAITYDTSSFSIHYADSTNLKHEGDTIHKAYNGWVMRLEREIKHEVAFRLGG